MNRIETEVLLIGAGPIGIEMAVALATSRFDYVHLEAGTVASTIQWFPPEMQFFSSPKALAVAGVPFATANPSRATREEYLEYLDMVVDEFALEIQTNEKVTQLTPREDGRFEVTSRRKEGERNWLARKVILAIGDLHRPRKLEIPGEDLPHVSHYFGDPKSYMGKKVLVVGGKNSAVEAAIRCVGAGGDVTLSYRGAHFDEKRVKPWLLPAMRTLIRDGDVDFLPSTVVKEIRKSHVVLERTAGPGDKRIDLSANRVLLLTGYEQDAELFEQAGVTLDGEAGRPRFDESTMETDVPGVFVAGTASAGTQLGGRWERIETSHVHVGRIIAALRGGNAPPRKQAVLL